MTTNSRSLAAKKGWLTRRKNAMEKSKPVDKLQKLAAKKSALLSALAKLRPGHKMSFGAEPNLTLARVTTWIKDAKLHEIYSTGMKYAFISNDWKQSHTFVLCKDFLQDAVWATVNKCESNIYGFHFRPGENAPVDLSRVRIAVRHKNPKFEEDCLRALTFIRELDAAQKFEPTELHFGGLFNGAGEKVYVFVGDKRWLHSTVLLSLYALAIRVGMTYNGIGWKRHYGTAKKYFGTNDKEYTRQTLSVLDKIVGKSPYTLFHSKMEDNYKKGLSISDIHERGGIVAVAEGSLAAGLKCNISKK